MNAFHEEDPRIHEDHEDHEEDDRSTVADLDDFATRFNITHLPCKHCHKTQVPIEKFKQGITAMIRKGSTKLPKTCDVMMATNDKLHKYHNDIYNRKNALKKLLYKHPWLEDHSGQMYESMKQVSHPLYLKYVDLQEKIQTATHVYNTYKQSLVA